MLRCNATVRVMDVTVLHLAHHALRARTHTHIHTCMHAHTYTHMCTHTHARQHTELPRESFLDGFAGDIDQSHCLHAGREVCATSGHG